MKILSIDTTTKTGSVAVLSNSKILSEKIYNTNASHAEVLMGVIDDALSAAKIELEDIEGLAVSIGPGSFTGIRIGLATAKGLALVGGKPIVGVSSLEALALNPPLPPFNKGGGGRIKVPCINAYRGEVYTAVIGYRLSAIDKEYFISECSITPEELCEKLKAYDKDFLFVGDGAVHYRELFKERLGARFILEERKQYPLAVNIGLIALERFKAGHADDIADIATLRPNYIRKTDAEIGRQIKN